MVVALQRFVAGTSGPRRAASAVLAGAFDRFVVAQAGRFSLWLPVLMGFGVLVYLGLRVEPPLWIGGGATSTAAVAAVLCRRPVVVRVALIGVTATTLGFAAAQFATWRAAPLVQLPTHAVIATGTVRLVEPLPEGERVTLGDVHLVQAHAEEQTYPRRLRIRLRATDPLAPEVGGTIRVRAMVRPPSSPAYPGGWDLQREAFFGGLGGYGYAIGAAEAVAGPVGWFDDGISWLRQAIDARIAAALSGPAGAIAATLLTGVTSSIPAADRAAFRDSGLAHLLAVAGLHVGIVMGLIGGVVRAALALSERAALRWPCKQIAAVAALLAGGGYMLLTGTHLPIVRSFAMAALFTLAVLAGRRAASLRGLALAASVLLLLEPAEIAGVSFQMSFAAVLALIVGWQAARPALWALRARGGWQGWIGHHVGALALTSVLAGVASAPFGAYHFGRVQLYFILSNVVAVPLTAFWVMPAGLLALALMPFGLERLALVPMGWGIDGLLWIARTTEALPEAVFAVPHMPEWGLALVALGMAWGGLWRGWIRLGGVPPLLLGLLSPVWADPPDLLISADARLLGARTEAGFYVRQAAGASRFTIDAWQQFLASGAPLPWPRPGAPESAGLACDPGGCVARPRPDAMAALLPARGRRPNPDCRAIDLVIAIEPGATASCPFVPAMNRAAVFREGAVAIWLAPDGLRVLTDRDSRGARPWVPPSDRPSDAPLLPPAALDALPDSPAARPD